MAGKCREVAVSRGVVFRAVHGLALALAMFTAQAAVPYDPFYVWRTLETPHFRIHFRQEDEHIAQRAAVIAERVHVRLGEQMRWTPDEKTEVVISDDFDLSNGYATPYPYNMMGLFVVPPEPGSFMSVDSLEQWLEDLIEHEYAHALHLDNAAGFPRVMRRIFGRQVFTFPNMFQPLWLIEGLATWHETDAEQDRGRGQAAEFATYMRTEVAHGVKPLQQASVPNASWPAGTLPYLYGVHFFQFLEARYGRDSVQDFVDAYSRNFIPFRVNGTARRVFGKDMYTLWDEFEDYLEERYLPELEAIRGQGVVEGDRLTFDGYVARHEGGNLDVTPNGDVYFVRDDGRRRPALMRQTASGEREQLVKLNPGARISVHPEAGVLIAQPEICRERRLYYDVFLLKPGRRSLQRLTHCSRYRDVAWHPDGKRFVATRLNGGNSELHLLDSEGRFLQTLVEGADDELFAQPDWSPDGSRIVLVRTRRGEGADLYEFHPGEDHWQRLTHDRNFEFHPRYSPDGKHVLFSSDHGGVFNLRRLALETGEVATLSRVETGAYYPVQGSNGAVHYLAYGPEGYDLHVLNQPAALPTPAGRSAVPPPEPVQAADFPVREYSPWQTLMPRLWFPYINVDEDLQELGAITFGQDVLGIHQYALMPVIDITNEAFIGAASYAWSDRLFLDVSRLNDRRHDDDFNLIRVRRNDDAVAALRIPFSRYDRSWNFYVGGALDRETDLMLGDGQEALPDLRDDLYGIALLYRNSHQLRFSISEQEGRQVKLVAERSTDGSDYTGDVYTLDWREYFHLGNTHVLGVRYVRGWGTDAPRPFSLGGARGTGFSSLVIAGGGESVFNQRRYGLRGYRDGYPALRGRRMHVATLEYRFPLTLFERGVMSPPVGLHRWSGNVFVDAGAAWDETRPSSLHPGAGFEAVMDVTAGYWLLGARLRIGYAHGFDREAGGTDQVYLSLGASF